MAALTLDDWVVSLRSRFIYSDDDPGVSIDPREDLKNATGQDVRFFAGVENTRFGNTCLEADWLMKKIGMGLEKTSIQNMKTYFDLLSDRVKISGNFDSEIRSRFWFYPIVNKVNVLGNVVFLERFQMGIFTEVMAAKVNGVSITNLSHFDDAPSREFSRSFSRNLSGLAETYKALDLLRGLTQLAGLAKGLAQTEWKIQLGYWLKEYPVEYIYIPTEVGILNRESPDKKFRVFGGVQLAALVVRLKSGDLEALQEITLSTKPEPTPLLWEFNLSSENGIFRKIELPDPIDGSRQVSSLWAQVLFHIRKKNYDSSIVLLDEIIQTIPNEDQAYYIRGLVNAAKGLHEKAIADYNKTLEINPSFIDVYKSRGIAYAQMELYNNATADFNRILEINPDLVNIYKNRGIMYLSKGLYDKAITDFNRFLAKYPEAKEIYINRGAAYASKELHDNAIDDFNKALQIDPACETAYSNRGIVYVNMGLHDGVWKGKLRYDAIGFIYRIGKDFITSSYSFATSDRAKSRYIARLFSVECPESNWIFGLIIPCFVK